MFTYGDLDLKHLREVCDIDFAHFTYQKNQCSCCFGPKDLPKIYWRNNTIPDGDNYTFILFKNANNGSGVVTSNTKFKDYQCINWNMSWEKLEKVIEELRRQIPKEYKIIKPIHSFRCIEIVKIGSKYDRED